MSKALSTTVQQALAAKRQNMTERLAGLGGGGSTPFIRAKANTFIMPDEERIKNELSVIVLDWAFHYAWWEGQYEPGATASPVCVAVGQVAANLAPASTSPKPQNDKCATCPKNQFGSGGGNRKACKNTINLAVMRWDEEVEDDTIYFLSIPPASLNNWGAYDKKLMENGFDSSQVVTVISFDDSVDYVKFKFTADRNMTKEYVAEDEDGGSYLNQFLSNLPKATETLLREPQFSTDE